MLVGKTTCPASAGLFTGDEMKYIAAAIAIMAMPCHAAIIPAASCSSGDVTAAIEASSNGDTVSVPAGACTWNTQVSLGAKSITLEGAGAGKTIITNNYANTLNHRVFISNTFLDYFYNYFVSTHLFLNFNTLSH